MLPGDPLLPDDPPAAPELDPVPLGELGELGLVAELPGERLGLPAPLGAPALPPGLVLGLLP